jgi:hypothetical protein
MYGSLGARASRATASMAASVTRMGNKATSRGNVMMNSGLGGPSTGMASRLRTGQAMAGRGLMSAGRYAANNPNRTMGIAAGVTGAGAYGVNRRRGSQNYPMY